MTYVFPGHLADQNSNVVGRVGWNGDERRSRLQPSLYLTNGFREELLEAFGPMRLGMWTTTVS